MTIRELGQNRWKVVIYAGLDDGRQRQKSQIVDGGRRKAEKVERQMLEERDRVQAETRDRALTVNGLVDDWIATRDRLDSPTTIYRRASIVEAIRKHLGHVRAVDLTADHVDEFYNKLRDEKVRGRRRSESTIHHYHRVLTAILVRAERRDRVTTVATRKATRPVKPKIGTAAAEPPDAETVQRLMEAAPLGFGTAVHLTAATGLRRGEVMALRWTDFDKRGQRLRVSRSLVHIPGTRPVEANTKTGQTNWVDLDADTIDELDNHYRRMRTEIANRGGTISDRTFVFADLDRDPTGMTPLSPDWLSGQWRRLCRRMGVDARFHGLRHFHATQLIDQGVPLPVVSKRLRHSLTSTTANIYAHALEESGKEAATVIRKVLAAKALPA